MKLIHPGISRYILKGKFGLLKLNHLQTKTVILRNIIYLKASNKLLTSYHEY